MIASMDRTRLVYAIVVSLCSVVVACNQPLRPIPLSDALRAHVKDERFQTVTSIRGLPLGVLYGLENLFGNQTLDMVEPEAKLRFTDVIINPTMPRRRLVMAGCSVEYCLVYYERRGIAHTWHVALFHWTPAATRLEWGGTAPGGLKTIDDVRNVVVSGAVGQNGVW